MYVRKFEADSLDSALKAIKTELGPDAIILKTITNKGLKGAFKKKKIEITAAISEKSYLKKAKVDQVLDEGQKEQFYSSDASHITEMINSHSGEGRKVAMSNARADYGNLGLNRQVNTLNNPGDNTGSNAVNNTSIHPDKLEDFLKKETDTSNVSGREVEVASIEKKPNNEKTEENDKISAPVAANKVVVSDVPNTDLWEQQVKIDELESKLFQLVKKVEQVRDRGPLGLYQLSVSLRSLDISESYIQGLIKKALFDLNEEELENPDIVFEYGLQEMLTKVNTAMPLFSSSEVDNNPVITVFLSETSCGQTSMMLKLGAMKEDSVLIRTSGNNQVKRNGNFTERMFEMDVIEANSISEIISECRKALDKGKSVFVDYYNKSGEEQTAKKFIDGLRRSFSRVELLVSLSAIHSELYNNRIVSTYKRLADGLVVSHLDLCLNFGALFNIAERYPEVPFKFFGTGELVPDDIESATAERILAGIFQLN